MEKKQREQKQTTNPQVAPGLTENPLRDQASPKEIRRGEYTQVIQLEEEPPDR
ncbi:hypothetical protein [Melghirimyces algeriensis]|uniref:Uncharacterized protein n=1 Tax=Melghirimyces algeriensis TaxID=910412 RepID=A0A521DIH0_9BACL|nr:hypothetical protein [Melghirimyces algeriensis]SMO70941.1 hypothetical protein SAMN06264849_10653 [Melghirimyces algeriensis]